MYLYTYRQNTCTDKTNKNGLISEDKKWQREKKIEVPSGDMDTWHLDTWTLQSENQLKYEGLSLGPAVVCTVVAEREQNRPVKPNTGREEPSRHHDQRAVSLADWGRKEGNAPGKHFCIFPPPLLCKPHKTGNQLFQRITVQMPGFKILSSTSGPSIGLPRELGYWPSPRGAEHVSWSGEKHSWASYNTVFVEMLHPKALLFLW